VSELSVVVVSYNTRDVLASCLARVAGGPWETIVVDNGSADGSPELVRERFPGVRLIETGANLGMGPGNNVGIRASDSRYVLVLNSDAWPVEDGVERLVAFADRRPRAGAVGPRIVSPDGSPQRSVRGFPTVWRLATEYFFLRKLAPRSPLVNAFYAGDFDFASERDAEFLMGAALLLRREALDEVGLFDEDYFMFSEETDLCYRLHAAGWGVVFTPEAEFVHLGGASTRAQWGRMFREQVRGHLRFLTKHDSPRAAERARRVMLLALRMRGVLFRGTRGRTYREAARWLASAPADALLQSSE
jgi:N-acetylglucosaminyl-diphospho-decaprenol L-rhamnosyltransferase